MPLPMIADTIRTSVEGVGTNSHKWANIMHFRKSGVLTFPGAIAILDPILLNHYTVNSGAGFAWKGVAPVSSSLQQFRYTPLDGVSASTVISHVTAGVDGADPLPVSVALVVTLRTILRGRSHRGRVYTGPYAEDSNLAGVPWATNLAGILVQWQRLLSTALPGSGLSLVVASYKFATAEDVVSVSIDGRWDTQRRRLNA